MNPFERIPVQKASLQKVIENDVRLHKEIDDFMGAYDDEGDDVDLFTFDYSTLLLGSTLGRQPDTGRR